MSHCAPTKNSSNDCSCFTKTNLLAIAMAWNSFHSSTKEKHIQVKPYMTKCTIWNRIDNVISEYSDCDNEQCWIKLEQLAQFSKHHKGSDYFRPLAPGEWFHDGVLIGNSTSTDMWLSSTDISSVMDQYDGDKYKFLFLGTVPIDFAQTNGLSSSSCIGLDWGPMKKTKYLCDIDTRQLQNDGIEQFGVVFNTADHTSSGQHWIALYCSLKKRKIVYFDSYGYPPPKEVNTFITRIQDSEKNKKYSILVNNKRHQQQYSECGMYAIHFLINMLMGVSWTSFNRHIISDTHMLQKRMEYFNHYKTYE